MEKQPANPLPGRLVVIGSSAGGIEALSVFVESLPPDFPVPIVLAQHLDPRRHSTLDAILQRRTALPVRVIESHTLLQAGEIYVVPENRHVTLNDGYIETQEDHLGRPRPSIDLLLTSAARAYGERLIAVILTGSGSNGAAGAIAVKQAGGTVIIQNPQTARFPSMPLALPPTIVDFQVDIERLAPLLYHLLTEQDEAPENLSGEVTKHLLEYIKEQEHIDLSTFRREDLLRHIRYRMLASDSPTMQSYLNYLKAHPEEAGELTRASLVCYTQFFRDPETFACLQSTLLPELLARGRERGRTLRCWAAGCATGEEAYSLAMLISDMLGEERSQWRVNIFATDLNESAISFARRGVYAENALEALSSTDKERFFERLEHGYRVDKSLRSLVIFGQQDLTRTTPFPAIDLLLCRNVLCYFTPDVQEHVLNQFAFSLFPGGYLLLGKDERIRPPALLYESASRDWNIYRCIGKAKPSMHFPAPAKAREPHSPARLDVPVHQLVVESSIAAQTTLPAFDIGELRRFNELLFRAFPIGMVVIDRSYAILTANGIARRLLRIQPQPPDQDFLHAVPGIPYQQVRAALDAALQERGVTTLPEVELDVTTGGSGRFVALSVAPIQLDSAPPELVVISIIDITEQVLARRRLEALQAEQEQLVNALGGANRRLNEVNQALLKANEALEATNEDMIVTQEELQARLEELETTNEELQADFEEVSTGDEALHATIGELETANRELQTTSAALTLSNGDLKARAGELQAQNDLLAEERRHLAEIIECAPFSIIMLRGPDLRVESFNARGTPLLKSQEVLGLPLAKVAGQFWEGDVSLVRLANEVYQQGAPRVLHRSQAALSATGAAGKTGGSQVYTLLPAHDAGGKVSGVIIYAVDEVETRENTLGESLLDTAR